MLNQLCPLIDPVVVEVFQLALQSTYFTYNADYYEQKDGVARGSPLSQVIANVYTKFLNIWHLISLL